MIRLILALIIGFLLGVLLMVFLIAGREEDLLDRVEKAKFSGLRIPRASDDERAHASEEAGERSLRDED